MGYQECWVTVYPSSRFNKVVAECARLKKTGFYENSPCAVEPLSVVVMKQDIGTFSAGTKVLWVAGERCFCNAKWPIVNTLEQVTSKQFI